MGEGGSINGWFSFVFLAWLFGIWYFCWMLYNSNVCSYAIHHFRFSPRPPCHGTLHLQAFGPADHRPADLPLQRRGLRRHVGVRPCPRKGLRAARGLRRLPVARHLREADERRQPRRDRALPRGERQAVPVRAGGEAGGAGRQEAARREPDGQGQQGGLPAQRLRQRERAAHRTAPRRGQGERDPLLSPAARQDRRRRCRGEHRRHGHPGGGGAEDPRQGGRTTSLR